MSFKGHPLESSLASTDIPSAHFLGGFFPNIRSHRLETPCRVKQVEKNFVDPGWLQTDFQSFSRIECAGTQPADGS